MKQNTDIEKDTYTDKNNKKTNAPDVIEAAAKLFSYKEWTKSALADRLTKRGYTAKEIDEATAWLVDQGLIDDQRYAVEYASGKMRTRLWGMIKISVELKRRGIDKDLIDEALTPLRGPKEEAAALSALQKWLRIKRFAPPLSSVVYNKAASHLRSKGFTGAAIGFAMNKESRDDSGFYPEEFED